MTLGAPTTCCFSSLDCKDRASQPPRVYVILFNKFNLTIFGNRPSARQRYAATAAIHEIIHVNPPTCRIFGEIRIVCSQMAAKNRGRNQVKVRLDGYTPNSQERRESRNLGEAGAPLRPAPRKTRRKYRSHGSDMTRLVTAVKNAYLSRQSLSEPKNTNIPVQLYPYIPCQHRKSQTARSTPATALLKL